jgi:methanogenic corrinoid protein MtbC1
MLNLYEELGESSRQAILGALRFGPQRVSEIVAVTGLRQPNVSNHLARMREKGLVVAHKVGREVFYTLATPEIVAAVQAVFGIRLEPETEVDLGGSALTFARSAIEGDEPSCSAILDSCLRARASLTQIYEQVLGVAMGHIGEWYKIGAIDEAQEHMASFITERMMAKTMQMTPPVRRSEHTAVLGCAPGSRHVIGLRMIADYLRTQGWSTQFLGADVPIAAFVGIVKNQNPTLVLISIGSTESVDSTAELVRALVPLVEGRIVVGGAIISQAEEDLRKAGASYVARSLSEFSNEILPQFESA